MTEIASASEAMHVSPEWLADLEHQGPPPPNGWSFDLDNRVDHVDGGWPATVVGRYGAAYCVSREFPREMVWVHLDNPPDERSGDLRCLTVDALIPLDGAA